MCEHGIDVCLPYYIQTNRDPNQYKPLIVDLCLADITQKLHSEGIRTYGSCCGHFTYCGGFTIDVQSVYRALQCDYDVTQQWMVDLDIGKEFIIWHLNLLNNCTNCHANTDVYCPCYCSCHNGKAKYAPHLDKILTTDA